MMRAKFIAKRAYAIASALSLAHWLMQGGPLALASAFMSLFIALAVDLPLWAVAVITGLVTLIVLVAWLAVLASRATQRDERWLGVLRQLISDLQAAIDRLHSYNTVPASYFATWATHREPFARQRDWHDAYHATARAFDVTASVNDEMATAPGSHPFDVEAAESVAAHAIAELDQLALEHEERLGRQ